MLIRLDFTFFLCVPGELNTPVADLDEGPNALNLPDLDELSGSDFLPDLEHSLPVIYYDSDTTDEEEEELTNAMASIQTQAR